MRVVFNNLHAIFAYHVFHVFSLRAATARFVWRRGTRKGFRNLLAHIAYISRGLGCTRSLRLAHFISALIVLVSAGFYCA